MSNRNKVQGNGLADILGILAETIAFFTIILFLVMLVQANWPFITSAGVLNVLNILMFYAPFALTLVVGLQVTSRQPFLIRIVFYIAMALIIVFQFFPGTWQNLIKIVE